MFESIFGHGPAKRMQLYHHDNGDIEFIPRHIIGESATELNKDGTPNRSWIDYFQTLYQFDGYKNIPAEAIQLAYSRHFHLEIHNILPEDKRPPDGDSMNNAFITAIAETRAVEINKAKKPHTIYEKMTYLLGSVVIMEMLIWGISYATR